MQFSLTKADRILKRSEFIALSRAGRKVQNAYFIACFAPGHQPHCRLGITVTKKVGKAVERNRIKRMVREFFRANRQRLSGNWDISIIAKIRAAGISSETVGQSLQDIFDRISRYENH